MPRLSIVIPWLGPVSLCEETLAAVLQNRPAGCEILVPLAEHYDDPYELGEEVSFLPGTEGDDENLVALVNRGVAAASADVVNVIPCGLLATEGWASAALLQFHVPQVAAVAPVIVSDANRQRVLSAGINYTLGGVRQLASKGESYDVRQLVRSQPLGATLAGGFFRKSVLEALGGFDASLGAELADVDLALCLKALNLCTECEPTSRFIDQRPATGGGSFRAGYAAERCYLRHLDPSLRRTAMPNHALRLVGELALCLVQPWWVAHLAGRACGLITSALEQQHALRLATARERLAEQNGADANIVRMPTKDPAAPSVLPQRRAA